MDDRRPWGLPELALTVGASWSGDACPRRVLFERIEGLRPVRRAEALRYGSAWNDVVMDDVHRWWQLRPDPYRVEHLTSCGWCGGAGDCDRCGGTGLGPVARQDLAWRASADPRDWQRGETLRRAAEGWLIRWGARPPAGWLVVGVEVPLAYPIPSPDSRRGETYAPEMPVVRGPDGRARFARMGEGVPGALPNGWTLSWERVPAWCSVRLDALWCGPRGEAVVGEFKSSQDPSRYLEGLVVDPQVTVYELALDRAARDGTLWLPGPGRIAWPSDQAPRGAGWWYDVASSHRQQDPHVLSGRARRTTTGAAPVSVELSTARGKLASVTSWRLRAALLTHGIPATAAAGKDEHGRPVTWADRLADAVARVDPRFYVREAGASSSGMRVEVLLEQYATARRRAAQYRAAALVDSDPGLRLAFPRVSVCRAGGGARCPYVTPCVQDGPHARAGFTTRHDPVVDAEVEDAPDPDAPIPDPEAG